MKIATTSNNKQANVFTVQNLKVTVTKKINPKINSVKLECQYQYKSEITQNWAKCSCSIAQIFS